MEYVNILLIVLFISLFAYVVFKGSGKHYRNQRYKEITVAAKLADKRIQKNESMRFGFGIQPEKERYYMTFRTDDGTSLEFKVTQTNFYAFEIGMAGKLTYQDSSYTGFESDEN